MKTTTTRQEHIAWCKERALAYLERGDLHNAFASLNSDLGKHPETVGHSAIELGMMLMAAGHLNTPKEMRDWINGVH